MTTDQACFEAIKRGYVIVHKTTGKVYATRCAGKQIGTRNTKGYIVATLHVDGERKQVKLHRLIWISVHGLPAPGILIDHKNRIKSCNRISNLKAVGPIGNAANRRRYTGENNPAAKITKQIANQIRKAHKVIRSYGLVAASFGVSRSLVAQIVRRELWVPNV